MLEKTRSSVRPIVTYAFTAAFVYGFVSGMISAEAFLTMSGFVIKSWFDARQQDRAQEKPISLTEQVK